MPDLEKLWEELNQKPIHRFADWPNKEVPKGKPGVYLIYQEGLWIYIGMSFKNLQSRLSQHASGRRSGDQFCVYVGDRLVRILKTRKIDFCKRSQRSNKIFSF